MAFAAMGPPQGVPGDGTLPHTLCESASRAMLINFPNSQLAHVCQLAGTNYPGALLLLDLYGALAYKAGSRVQRSTSKRKLAFDRCTNIKTIDRQLASTQIGIRNTLSIIVDSTVFARTMPP